MTSPLLAALGPRAHPLRAAFQAIDVAEEEVRKVFEAKADEPPGLFAALFPPPSMRSMTLDLYRAHVRELVDRARAGEDLAPGTRAEVLASLYGASARAPLRSEAWAIYHRLFAELLPDQFARLPPSDRANPQERWEGQVEEDIRAAQRAIRDESRRLSPRARRERTSPPPGPSVATVSAGTPSASPPR